MPTCPTCRKKFPDDTAECPDDGAKLLPDEAFSSVDPDLGPGETVGEYRIEEKIGVGGFGAVYRAVHPVIGKPAAIKVLHRQYSVNPPMVARFIDEARAVNQIRHRNIIDIFSFGVLDDGRHYYVMELLEGVTLQQYLKERGRLSVDEAIPVLRQVARALDAAHACGIAHRDLKPDNIFLSFDEDEVCHPKLLDFGIAKLLGESRTGEKTRTGTPMGTPLYMSPEQCRGANIDHRTDIYSFGILVHEALTGKVPFDSDSVMQLMVLQTSEPAPAMSSVVPELDSSLDGPVLDMLEKDPADRPRTVSEGLEALAHAARTAGFDIPAPVKSISSPRNTAVQSRRNTKTVVDPELADAKTIVQDTRRTFQGAESSVAPVASPRRTAFLVGGAAMVVGVGIALAFMLGRGSSAEGERAPYKVAVPSSTAVQASRLRPYGPPGGTAQSSAGAPTAEPAAPPSASASAATLADAGPSLVEISVQCSVPGVEIFLGDRLIGTSDAPVQLPEASEPVELTFRKPGYHPKMATVTPTANVVVPIELVPQPSKVKPPPEVTPGSGDLEF